MPSNPQQNDLGMESNASIAWDLATLTGAGCMVATTGRVVRPGWLEMPPSFGRGCRIGEATILGGTAIVGGGRCGRMAGDRAGRGIRAISYLALSSLRPGVTSGVWGGALRTVSFFGSAMPDRVAPRKLAENSLVVTR
jgi:hypothetical protein